MRSKRRLTAALTVGMVGVMALASSFAAYAAGWQQKDSTSPNMPTIMNSPANMEIIAAIFFFIMSPLCPL